MLATKGLFAMRRWLPLLCILVMPFVGLAACDDSTDVTPAPHDAGVDAPAEGATLGGDANASSDAKAPEDAHDEASDAADEGNP